MTEGIADFFTSMIAIGGVVWLLLKINYQKVPKKRYLEKHGKFKKRNY